MYCTSIKFTSDDGLWDPLNPFVLSQGRDSIGATGGVL